MNFVVDGVGEWAPSRETLSWDNSWDTQTSLLSYSNLLEHWKFSCGRLNTIHCNQQWRWLDCKDEQAAMPLVICKFILFIYIFIYTIFIEGDTIS